MIFWYFIDKALYYFLLMEYQEIISYQLSIKKLFFINEISGNYFLSIKYQKIISYQQRSITK